MDSAYALVNYDTAIATATPGAGNFVCGDDSAAIDSQPSSNTLRWGPYFDPVLTGDGWSTGTAAGFTFTGGAILAVPVSGTIE